MEHRKGEQENQEQQASAEEYVVCRVCGRKIKPDGCSWHEDEGGMICSDCRAEQESCGCSD